jgi:hypothetical protein
MHVALLECSRGSASNNFLKGKEKKTKKSKNESHVNQCFVPAAAQERENQIHAPHPTLSRDAHLEKAHVLT